MKKIILNLLKKDLQCSARLKMRWVNPKVVAVTGSYGKTSSKEAVYQVLSKKFGGDVGKNWGNMNSVIGLPLAILGLKKYSFGIGFIFDLIKAKWNLSFYRLPIMLVLEMGVDRPGEMQELLKIATPDIATITGISHTHIEEFGTLDGVRKEKNLIFEALPKDGVAITNADDKNSKDLIIPEGIKHLTFGITDADVQAENIEVTVDGTNFDLSAFGKKTPIKSKLVGSHSIKSLLVATAVANQFGINISEIKEILEEIKPQNSRMNIVKIRDNMVVIDDSYNSNPKSAEKALATLGVVKTEGRRIAVLGNMNELGDYTTDGHVRVGVAAGKVADLFLAVGENADHLADGAKKSGMSADKIIIFKTTLDIICNIDNIIKPKDLILVKGSQNGVRLERLVKHLINDDKRATEILCRQEKKWQER